MEWLKEWAKPAVIIVAVGVFATCGNNALNQRFDSIDQRFGSIDQRFNSIDQRFNSIDQRFDSMDSRLQAIDKRTFEMNTRLSRIEGKLDITMNISDNETPPADIRK